MKEIVCNDCGVHYQTYTQCGDIYCTNCSKTLHVDFSDDEMDEDI